jgi:energy-coupling factor transporter ATP-binding protein EcfA2
VTNAAASEPIRRTGSNLGSNLGSTPCELEAGGGSPYPGLRPFEESDRDFFFGRDAHVDHLLQHLTTRRFVAVVGPSGCGKSSLVRAGLIPALRGGMLENRSSKWVIPVMRPGGEPSRALNAALRTLLDSKQKSYDPRVPFEVGINLKHMLDDGPEMLLRAAAQLTVGMDVNVLLLVDQFEELFRFNRRPGDDAEWFDRSQPFVQQLLTAVSEPEGPRARVYVVATMRDEHVGKCAIFPGLAEALNAGMYLVPRLTRAQLADAVRLPARVRGLEVADALVEQVVNDCIAVQDELPVLQHAMMRTWLRLAPSAKAIGLADYHGEQVGTIRAALDKHGNEILGIDADGKPTGKISAQEYRLAEVVLKRLTLDTGDQSTRSPARLGKLAAIAGVDWNDAELERMLGRFRAADCQFLVPPAEVKLEPDTEIDLTHEAILRTWLKLKDWAAGERRDGEIYRRLVDAALLREDEPASQSLVREPQLGSLRKWWDSKVPTAAWAERYHPAPAKLPAKLRKAYTLTEAVKGVTREVPNHAALLASAEQFLVASERSRNWRRALMLALLGVLAVAIVLLLTDAARKDAQSRVTAAENEGLKVRMNAAQKEAEAQRKEVEAQRKEVEAQRKEAEAQKKEAEARKKELEARNALDISREDLKKANAKLTRKNAALMQEKRDYAGQLRNLASYPAKAMELAQRLCRQGDVDACLDAERLRRVVEGDVE